MFLSIISCIFLFIVLVWHTRRSGMSLGLPVAYLYAVLFQHLPGGIAHFVGDIFFRDSSDTEIGMRLTALGTGGYVLGVILAQKIKRKSTVKTDIDWLQCASTLRFARFCLVGGWLGVALAILLQSIPSLGAAIENATTIWILGIIIGSLAAVSNKNLFQLFLWLGALLMYVTYALVFGGFLSSGSVSVFLVVFAMAVTIRSHFFSYTGVTLFTVGCFLAFLSYYQNRIGIRDATWGGGSLHERFIRSSTILTDIAWFDSENPLQLRALDERLNQNFFVGRAVTNLASGQVEYLYGESIWDGMQAMVPRILWPGKPIFAGNTEFIRKFADLQVSEGTTFGVGQVMEYYINFGTPGVVVGFLLFGFGYGWIDRNAAFALRSQHFGQAIIWISSGIALFAPLASISQMLGNLAAALFGAFGLRYAWNMWQTIAPSTGSKHAKKFKRLNESLSPEKSNLIRIKRSPDDEKHK